MVENEAVSFVKLAKKRVPRKRVPPHVPYCCDGIDSLTGSMQKALPTEYTEHLERLRRNRMNGMAHGTHGIRNRRERLITEENLRGETCFLSKVLLCSDASVGRNATLAPLNKLPRRHEDTEPDKPDSCLGYVNAVFSVANLYSFGGGRAAPGIPWANQYFE